MKEYFLKKFVPDCKGTRAGPEMALLFFNASFLKSSVP